MKIMLIAILITWAAAELLVARRDKVQPVAVPVRRPRR